MEFWFFVIPVLIAGVVFFIVSQKKDKSTAPIHKIDLTQNNQGTQELVEDKLTGNKKSDKSVAKALDSAKNEQAKSEASAANDGLKSNQNEAKAELKTRQVRTELDTEPKSRLEIRAQKDNKIGKVKKVKKVKKVREIGIQGKKQMELIFSFLKKMASKASELAKRKENQSSLEADSHYPSEDFSNQSSSSQGYQASQTIKDSSQIYLYLQSELPINGKKLVSELNNNGFRLRHNYGYIHQGMIIQEQDGGVINRMNLDSTEREVIRIHLDVQQINNDQEFGELIAIIANLAKELDCQILNSNFEPISEQDLEQIEKAVFN